MEQKKIPESFWMVSSLPFPMPSDSHPQYNRKMDFLPPVCLTGSQQTLGSNEMGFPDERKRKETATPASSGYPLTIFNGSFALKKIYSENLWTMKTFASAHIPKTIDFIMQCYLLSYVPVFFEFQSLVAFFLSFDFAVGYHSAGSLGFADSSSASYSIQNVTPLDHVLESGILHCPSPSLALFLSLQGPASKKSLRQRRPVPLGNRSTQRN